MAFCIVTFAKAYTKKGNERNIEDLGPRLTPTELPWVAVIVTVANIEFMQEQY